MEIGKDKVKVPNSCGDFCEYYKNKGITDMSSPCFRCPIMNCKDMNDGYTPLVKPEHFSSEIAKEYVDWWN